MVRETVPLTLLEQDVVSDALGREVDSEKDPVGEAAPETLVDTDSDADEVNDTLSLADADPVVDVLRDAEPEHVEDVVELKLFDDVDEPVWLGGEHDRDKDPVSDIVFGIDRDGDLAIDALSELPLKDTEKVAVLLFGLTLRDNDFAMDVEQVGVSVDEGRDSVCVQVILEDTLFDKTSVVDFEDAV